MSRLVLIGWNAGEAKERIARLHAAGYEAEFLTPKGTTDLRTFRENPPDAFLIDLSRTPSQGRAAAVALRRQKATRHAPLSFVGGAPQNVARVRELLPDAVYTDWEHIHGALRSALHSRAATPVVPGTMESYAGVLLPKKLGIKPHSTVALLGAPRGFEPKLRPLPEGVRVSRQPGAPANTILCFTKSQAELTQQFPAAARMLAEGGGLWIVWPKKSSGVSTDLTQNAVRALGLRAGFVDYKICAVDETWSGLLFARRRIPTR